MYIIQSVWTKWRFPSGGKAAMCFKSFLHVCDKACHHQRYLPIPVWPTARTFRPSHVNELTLDPNWPLLQRGCLVSRAEVFKFCLWNLSWPAGSFLPGWGIKNWQTQTTRVPVLAPAVGVTPLRRTHQTGFPPAVLLQLDRTPFLTGHGRSLLHTIKRTPPFQPVNRPSDPGSVCVPTYMLTLAGQSCVNRNRLTLFLIICWWWLWPAWEIHVSPGSLTGRC